MSTRKIKDAVDHGTKELIYFKGHAKATYMSDGSTVEDTINNIESKIDLSDYVTTDELEGYAKIEAIPSLEGYVKESDLPNFDEFAKTEDIPSLDGYAKLEDIPEIPEIPSLDDYATKEWVNNKNYATEYDLKTIDYSSINNTPTLEDETGELNITDENGNIGMKVSSEAVYAKDFIADGHKLSEKVNKDYVDNSIAELVDGAPETLNTLNEISAALKDNADIVDVLNQSIGNKQDAITDLETIRQGAAKGATALQSYTEQYKGTVTGVKVNGTTKNPSNGVVDLGTVITSHQDISGKQDTLVSGTNIKTINGQSILGSGNITIEGGSGNSDKINIDLGLLYYLGSETVTLTDEQYNVLVNINTSIDVEFKFGDINYYYRCNLQQNSKSSNKQFVGSVYVRKNTTDATFPDSFVEKYVYGTLTTTKILTIKFEDAPYVDFYTKSEIDTKLNGITGGTGNSDANVQAVDEISTIIDVDLDKYIVETTDDNITLDNNKYYKKTNVSSSISITLNTPEDNTVFTSFSIEFTTSETGTSVSLPDSIKWLNGELPIFENNFTYQISICNGLGVCAKYA